MSLFHTNAYWRARWAVARSGRSAYRRVRGGLRSIAPFWVRHRLSNLLAGRENAEKPLTDFAFPPAHRYDLICFPIIDWEMRFQRPQHLLTELARHGHRVFYLHTTFHQAGRLPLIRAVSENIFRVRLPGPSSPDALFQGDFGDDFEAACLGSLGALQRQAQIQKAICMVQLPNWADVAISCRRSQGWKIVYDCMDEHSGYTGSKPRNLEREARLIEESDLVIASSRPLFDKAKRQARRAILLPNAADFDHFNAPPTARPLEGLSRPIIGYFGAIAEWFDVDMIRAAAELRRGWQFVLIGDFSRADVAALRRLRNVHLLGELPYRVLPAYLHQLDVACIPFRINPLTMATSPVKFYEYLCAGKPVVSVPLPELEQYRDFFYPAQSGDELVRQIESALCEQSHEKSLARIELAKANTWSHRYAQLSEALESL